MRKVLIFLFVFISSFSFLLAEEIIIQGVFIGETESRTRNKYFINFKNMFVNNNDTLFFNIKRQISLSDSDSSIIIMNPGILGSEFLQKGYYYVIILESRQLKDIPFYNYYRINMEETPIGIMEACVDKAFYDEAGLTLLNNRTYVDIGNKLYEIKEISPRYKYRCW